LKTGRWTNNIHIKPYTFSSKTGVPNDPLKIPIHQRLTMHKSLWLYKIKDLAGLFESSIYDIMTINNMRMYHDS